MKRLSPAACVALSALGVYLAGVGITIVLHADDLNLISATSGAATGLLMAAARSKTTGQPKAFFDAGIFVLAGWSLSGFQRLAVGDPRGFFSAYGFGGVVLAYMVARLLLDRLERNPSRADADQREGLTEASPRDKQ